MKFVKILPFALVLLVMSGCAGDYRKVVVEGATIDSLDGLGLYSGAVKANVNVRIRLTNPTASKFEILSLKAIGYDENGKVVGDLASTAEALIPAHFSDTVTVPVEVRISDPLSLILQGGIKFDKMTADITITARQNGLVTATKKKEKVPLATLMKFAGK